MKVRVLLLIAAIASLFALVAGTGAIINRGGDPGAGGIIVERGGGPQAAGAIIQGPGPRA
jgi:hypothetical protein